ncbi:unnamed protein product [Eruca vesicaria subsp. sativa]|uniref:Uncharacterized protein n=1 Tax=Eruca vesicaria subsp. sativa TaxID=29727 RepID=A0ABC8ING8_ERUVS|nr:unnamed protein product [Eruca vesicaria subsp. sativa]
MVHEVITLGGGEVVSRSQVTSPPYHPKTMERSINGFMYYAVWAQVMEQLIYERILIFITTPKEVLVLEAFTLIHAQQTCFVILVTVRASEDSLPDDTAPDITCLLNGPISSGTKSTDTACKRR